MLKSSAMKPIALLGNDEPSVLLKSERIPAASTTDFPRLCQLSGRVGSAELRAVSTTTCSSVSVLIAASSTGTGRSSSESLVDIVCWHRYVRHGPQWSYTYMLMSFGGPARLVGSSGTSNTDRLVPINHPMRSRANIVGSTAACQWLVNRPGHCKESPTFGP